MLLRAVPSDRQVAAEAVGHRQGRHVPVQAPQGDEGQPREGGPPHLRVGASHLQPLHRLQGHEPRRAPGARRGHGRGPLQAPRRAAPAGPRREGPAARGARLGGARARAAALQQGLRVPAQVHLRGGHVARRQEEDDPLREADEALHGPEADQERLPEGRRDIHRGAQDGALIAMARRRRLTFQYVPKLVPRERGKADADDPRGAHVSGEFTYISSKLSNIGRHIFTGGRFEVCFANDYYLIYYIILIYNINPS